MLLLLLSGVGAVTASVRAYAYVSYVTVTDAAISAAIVGIGILTLETTANATEE